MTAIKQLSELQERKFIIAVGLLLGILPIYIIRAHIFSPHFMFAGDGVTNLLPALHVRASLAQWDLPIYTELWYNGQYQVFNPLWKGFYPPWWLNFIPGLPLLITHKITVTAHYVAVPVVVYWYTSKDFHWSISVPFAVLYMVPMVWFVGAYEKTLSWPWIALATMQLTPSRVQTRKGGILAGVGLGAALLTGCMYYFFYFGILVGCVVLATKSEEFLTGLVTGSVVGLPKILFSILPVMLKETSRPPMSLPLEFEEFFASLIGLWFSFDQGFYVPKAAMGGGWAAIGAPAILLSVIYFTGVYLFETEDLRLAIGVFTAACIGVMLSTGWGFLYEFPIIGIFRTAERATVLVAGALLLGVHGANRYAERIEIDGLTVDIEILNTGQHIKQIEADAITIGVSILLVLSSIGGLYAWTLSDNGQGEVIDPGERVADAVIETGCSDTWIEIGYNGSTPYDKVISYSLTSRNIETSATAYGKIGQQYSTHDENGRLTFELLIIGSHLPENQNVNLTGGWGGPVRGTIHTSRFELIQMVETERGPVYLYKSNRAKC